MNDVESRSETREENGKCETIESEMSIARSVEGSPCSDKFCRIPFVRAAHEWIVSFLPQENPKEDLTVSEKFQLVLDVAQKAQVLCCSWLPP